MIIQQILLTTFMFGLFFFVAALSVSDDSKWLDRFVCLMWLTFGLWVFEWCCLLIWFGVKVLVNWIM